MFKNKGKKKFLTGIFVAVSHKFISGAHVEHVSRCRQQMKAFVAWR